MKCPFCQNEVKFDTTFCPSCGKQIKQIYSSQSSAAPPVTPKVPVPKPPLTKQKNKWVSFFLCLFTMCGHKFYEGKYAMGFIYLCTAGLFGIGWFIDLVTIFFKPNPYYI